ncbi:MAG: hypothetical protein ABSF83_01280 [Nitrososphaerales archaeon]|jgi:hypothetical protein
MISVALSFGPSNSTKTSFSTMALPTPSMPSAFLSFISMARPQVAQPKFLAENTGRLASSFFVLKVSHRNPS